MTHMLGDEIVVRAGSGIQIPLILRYGQNYSDSALRGTLVLKSQLSTPGVFFYVNDGENTTTQLITHDDNTAQEIIWNDQAAGDLYVKIKSSDTQSLAVGTHYYELRIKKSAGDYLTLAYGRFIILPTIVGAP